MKLDKNFQPDRIGSYFRLEWLPLALVTVSGLVYNIGLLATPWFEGRLAQCLADILGGSATAAAMAMLVLAYVVVTLVVQAARFLKRFYVRRFANNINRRMKGILYANLVRQSRAALETEGAGELMTKAISDVDDCVEGMRKFTTEVFDTGVALAGYTVMLLVYDWRLALLCLLFTPVSYVCAARMKKPVQHEGAAYKKAAGALRAATLDRAQNAATYRIYGCETAREQRYEDVPLTSMMLRLTALPVSLASCFSILALSAPPLPITIPGLAQKTLTFTRGAPVWLSTVRSISILGTPAAYSCFFRVLRIL